MLQRGGLFASVVKLMDLGVFPRSNPYAWLRLNDIGLEAAITLFSDGVIQPEEWLAATINAANRGSIRRYSLKAVEEATALLPDSCYRESSHVREAKQAYGQQKVKPVRISSQRQAAHAVDRLWQIDTEVLTAAQQIAIQSMISYLS